MGHRMAKAGLELAVLDAALRAEGRSLGEYLGAERDRVPSGVSVGIQRDPAALVDAVGGYLDEGYVRIKIKIKPGRDVADTAAVREAFGAIPLQVDANSAYTLADVDTLAELDRFDLLLIEQPLQEDDIVDHATLARHLRTPVCLDESIVSLKAATDALALGAASVINIKAGRVGGYLEAVADPRPVPGCRHPGVVRRHARDRHRPRRERRARRAAGLHAAGRRLGVEPVLRPRHRDRAGRARGRARAGADRPRASASRSTTAPSRTSPSRARPCGGEDAVRPLTGRRARPALAVAAGRRRGDRCRAAPVRRPAPTPDPGADAAARRRRRWRSSSCAVDVAARQAQVEVHNGTERADRDRRRRGHRSPVRRGRDARGRQDLTIVPAGGTVDIRIQLPEMACDDGGGRDRRSS